MEDDNERHPSAVKDTNPGGTILRRYSPTSHLRPPGRIDIVQRAWWWKLVKRRRRTKFGKDKRRKHRHWLVTVYYHDGEKFGRVYTDREKAVNFAERQKKSPVVKTARVTQVG